MEKFSSFLKSSVATVFVGLIITGCGTTDSTKTNAQLAEENTALKTPTKTILTFEGDASRAYTVLGEVEYKHDKGFSGYGAGDSADLAVQKTIKDGLKRVAFTKYGEKVDAIINVKVGMAIPGGFLGTFGTAFGAPNVFHSGVGVAVSYSTSESKK